MAPGSARGALAGEEQMIHFLIKKTKNTMGAGGKRTGRKYPLKKAAIQYEGKTLQSDTEHIMWF